MVDGAGAGLLAGVFDGEGVFPVGPFVLPSAPFTPVASWDGTVDLSIFALSPPTPVLPDEAPVEELADGPFLLPASPWTPGPEFCGEVAAAVVGLEPLSAILWF